MNQPPPPAMNQPPPADTKRQPANHVPAYAAFGVGAVGIVVGTITGILASGKKGDLDDACVNKVCPASQQDTIDSGKTLGTVSTVGFVVGAVGAVAGLVLYLTAAPSVPMPATATLPTTFRF
jgi:hypothetical protein